VWVLAARECRQTGGEVFKDQGLVSRFRVQGLGFRDWGLGFGVEGSGFKLLGVGFGVWGLGCRVQAHGFGV
jgi:hypothetical protein